MTRGVAGLLTLAVALVAALACSDGSRQGSDTSRPAQSPSARDEPVEARLTDVPSPPSVSLDTAMVHFEVDTLARDLDVPWGLAALPDGRWLVTQRSGDIVAITPGDTTKQLWAHVDVYANDPGIGPETGLMGITIAPDFDRTGAVYVVATSWRTSGDSTHALGTRLWRRVAGMVDPVATLRFHNRVLRLIDRDGHGVFDTTVVADLPTAYYHAGGSVAFGPDRMMYVSIGDAMLPEHSTKAGVMLARVLRYTPTGAVPDDNPSRDDPTWARGLRNVQAFGWLEDGTMVATEHGPSGMTQEQLRRGHDELNILSAGANYGWPRVIGDASAEGVTPPILTWNTAIAPAGMAVYRGPIADWRNSVIVAGLHGALERVSLTQSGSSWSVAGRQRLLTTDFGRLRSVVVDSEGRILLTTSNRDVRGVARPGDDLLLRLTPRPLP